ncbi:hypothetical protein JCM19233_2419 [Vibrio astriarenae]|nr:hypothetical protein JCM19233_2419 [Vibrio sp. C7]
MNKKLVLMPAVLATAVMVGCNSDSGDDKDYQPSLVDLNIEVTNLDRTAEGYWLAVAYPVQTIVTAEYSDGSVKDVTGSES